MAEKLFKWGPNAKGYPLTIRMQQLRNKISLDNTLDLTNFYFFKQYEIT